MVGNLFQWFHVAHNFNLYASLNGLEMNNLQTFAIYVRIATLIGLLVFLLSFKF